MSDNSEEALEAARRELSEEVEASNPPKKMKVCEEEKDNWMFLFPDGTNIQFSKKTLKEKNLQLYEVLMKQSDEASDTIKMEDFNQDSFQTFLDYLLEKKTVEASTCLEDVLVLLRIAKKYELKDFISKWIHIVADRKVNEQFLTFLNNCAEFGFGEVIAPLLKGLTIRGKFNRLFDDDQNELLNLVKPKTLSTLLTYVAIDSEILKSIVAWGQSYVEKNKLEIELGAFFKEHTILDRLTLKSFESYETMLNFVDSDVGKTHFAPSSIINFFRKTTPSSIPDKGKWVKIKAGEKLTEKFELSGIYADKKTSVRLIVERNPIVFFEAPRNVENLATLDMTYVFYYDENHTCNIKNDREFSPKAVVFNSALYNSGKHCEEAVEVFMEWTFNVDCRIFKTLCEFPKIGDKNEYYFTSKIAAKEKSDKW